ncbi:unnamed protein product, partial [Rhizoctonia solani]
YLESQSFSVPRPQSQSNVKYLVLAVRGEITPNQLVSPELSTLPNAGRPLRQTTKPPERGPTQNKSAQNNLGARAGYTDYYRRGRVISSRSDQTLINLCLWGRTQGLITDIHVNIYVGYIKSIYPSLRRFS